MSIQVVCECGKRFRVDDKHRGKRFKCKNCGEPVRVPANDGAEQSDGPIDPFDESTIPEASKTTPPPAPTPSSSSTPAAGVCVKCGSKLTSLTTICLECGFDQDAPAARHDDRGPPVADQWSSDSSVGSASSSDDSKDKLVKPPSLLATPVGRVMIIAGVSLVLTIIVLLVVRNGRPMTIMAGTGAALGLAAITAIVLMRGWGRATSRLRQVQREPLTWVENAEIGKRITVQGWAKATATDALYSPLGEPCAFYELQVQQRETVREGEIERTSYREVHTERSSTHIKLHDDTGDIPIDVSGAEFELNSCSTTVTLGKLPKAMQSKMVDRYSNHGVSPDADDNVRFYERWIPIKAKSCVVGEVLPGKDGPQMAARADKQLFVTDEDCQSTQQECRKLRRAHLTAVIVLLLPSILLAWQNLNRLDAARAESNWVVDRGGRITKERAYFNGQELRSLDGIQKMDELVGLSLKNVAVSDLTPLEEMPNLRELVIENCPVRDLEPLRALNMQIVEVSNALVDDLGPLKFQTRMNRVMLSDANVKSLRPLAEMKKLVELQIKDFNGRDLTPLRNLKELTILDLGLKQKTDLSVVKQLPKLRRLGLHVSHPINLRILQGTGIRELELEGITQAVDLEPLLSLKLKKLIFRDCKLDRPERLQVLTKLEILRFIDSPIPNTTRNLLLQKLYATHVGLEGKK